MQPLEGDEQFACILLVEAGTVVADIVGLLLVAPAEGDLRVGDFPGEFGGVAEHILKDDAQQLSVTLNLQPRLNRESDRALGVSLGDLFRYLGGKCREVDRFGRQVMRESCSSASIRPPMRCTPARMRVR
jgi:hypothetical protein